MTKKPDDKQKSARQDIPASLAYDESISGRFIAFNETIFCDAIRENAAPTIIFQRPDDIKEKFREKLKTAFNKYAPSVLKYDTALIWLQQGTTNTAKIDQMGADLFRSQLNAMLKVAINKLKFENPRIFMTQDSRTFLQAAQEKRTIPFLMSYWDTAHVGAVENFERTLLQEGDWGFFMPGAPVPLHGYQKYNATSSIIIMPGGKWPPEPVQP